MKSFAIFESNGPSAIGEAVVWSERYIRESRQTANPYAVRNGRAVWISGAGVVGMREPQPTIVVVEMLRPDPQASVFVDSLIRQLGGNVRLRPVPPREWATKLHGMAFNPMGPDPAQLIPPLGRLDEDRAASWQAALTQKAALDGLTPEALADHYLGPNEEGASVSAAPEDQPLPPIPDHPLKVRREKVREKLIAKDKTQPEMALEIKESMVTFKNDAKWLKRNKLLP